MASNPPNRWYLTWPRVCAIAATILLALAAFAFNGVDLHFSGSTFAAAGFACWAATPINP